MLSYKVAEDTEHEKPHWYEVVEAVDLGRWENLKRAWRRQPIELRIVRRLTLAGHDAVLREYYAPPLLEQLNQKSYFLDRMNSRELWKDSVTVKIEPGSIEPDGTR